MPRPRFQKLVAEQQALILDAALREFAANGYADASLNRIIEASGISKGSMYYYFDSKEDLYAHVIRDQLERLIQRAGPLPVPDAVDADGFWQQLTDDYLRLLRAMGESPEAGALLRGWLGGAGAPSLGSAQREAEQEVLPWVTATLAAGQRIGAVRSDVADELLLAVVMGIGQAIDVWMITRPPHASGLEQAVGTVFGMMRRAVAPPGL
jgi:AcrR family transcriptional regulator